MEYTFLGQTGLKVSRLCLGTMNIRNRDDKQAYFRLLDAALDAGINFIDTADMYGRPESGLTEEIIGEWFALGGNRRERTILATKVYNDMLDPIDGANSVGNSAWRMRRKVDDCLKRLKTDYIDLLYMHEYDPNCTWNEVWGTYENLILAGKVIYAGGSNFADRHVWQAQNAAEKRGFLGLTCVQEKYNLIDRMIEVDLMPTLEELNLGLLAWSPLCGGVLSGNNLSGGGRRSAPHAQHDLAVHHERLERYSALCREIGQSEANVATAWLLANPVLTAPVIGPRTTEQLLDTVKAADLVLSDEVLDKLEEIFPGPGTAPDAYRA